MSANPTKSMVSAAVLILLGFVALFGGVKWVVLLIPAAVMVWYGVRPAVHSDRS